MAVYVGLVFHMSRTLLIVCYWPVVFNFIPQNSRTNGGGKLSGSDRGMNSTRRGLF